MIATYLHMFFFGIYPYLCVAIFIGGVIIRYDREQYTWKADSSMLLRKRGMVLAGTLFHIGIIFLFVGHLIGLMTPHSVYSLFVTPSQKATLAMVSGGTAGVICLAGMTYLLYRRLTDPRVRAAGKPSDTLILVLLYIQLILGLASIFHSYHDAEAGSMLALAGWVQHIFTFRGGAADLVVGEDWIFKAHVVLGMTIILLFPFTRLVHVLSGFTAPVRYLLRSGFQIARRRG